MGSKLLPRYMCEPLARDRSGDAASARIEDGVPGDGAHHGLGCALQPAFAAESAGRVGAFSAGEKLGRGIGGRRVVAAGAGHDETLPAAAHEGRVVRGDENAIDRTGRTRLPCVRGALQRQVLTLGKLFVLNARSIPLTRE